MGAGLTVARYLQAQPSFQLLESTKKEEINDAASVLRSLANVQRYAHWEVPSYVVEGIVARIMCEIQDLRCVLVDLCDCCQCTG